MSATIKYEHTCSFVGVLQYLEDGGLNINDKHLSKSEMEQAAADYRGVNRIHKPIALLFWTDCKNGNHKNWES